jgi:hypothetical protein
VHLELKTDIQFVGQDPIDNLSRIDPAKNGREENGVTTR